MCATCPFREGSPYADLASGLAISAITEGSRICHSTGSNNAINRRTGKPERLCRGARDVAIKYYHTIGFLKEPTDKAWFEKFKELQLKKRKNEKTKTKTAAS